jgi:hypothetical protein
MPRSPCPEGQVRNRTTKACRDRRRPGRRPGQRCPEGQVRNRTTKACRDRRRPGRRPAMKTAYICVGTISANNNNYNNNNNNNNYNTNNNNNNYNNNNDGRSDEEKIVEWYNDQASTLVELGYFKYAKIEHERGRRYKLSYIPSEGEDAEVALEMLADPDDDGNYPIKLGGEMVILTGELC